MNNSTPDARATITAGASAMCFTTGARAAITACWCPRPWYHILSVLQRGILDTSSPQSGQAPAR